MRSLISKFIALAPGIALMSACSFTFDGEAPDVPLLGAPPSLTSLPRYNRSLIDSLAIVQGRDRAAYLAMRPSMFLSDTEDYFEVLRIPPEVDENRSNLSQPDLTQIVEVRAERIYLYYTRFFLVNPKPLPEGFDPKEKKLFRIWSAGQTTPPIDLVMPPDPELLVVGLSDTAFVYWPRSDDTTTFRIYNSAGLVLRELPVMDGVDPENPLDKGALFFSGDSLFTRDAQGLVVRHELDKPVDVSLGVRPRFYIVNDREKALFTCGADGLRSVPIDGSLETILDETECKTDTFFFTTIHFYYYAGNEIRRVKLDGSEPYEVPFEGTGAKRVLTYGPKGELVFSTDDGRRYSNGAGDGWFDTWRFMDRGRTPSFNLDGTRLRWLEHAARSGGIGDFLSAPVPGGAPTRLARNVSTFNLLADGRTLAAANHAFIGAHNRVILFNKEDTEASWIVDGATDYAFLPGTSDILVDVIAGPSGYDIYRAPLPPKP